MTTTLNTSNLQTLLEFPFRQPNGPQKLAIGAALSLAGLVIPIVPTLFVLGYQKAVARRAILTGELVLPEWDDWSTYLMDGLKVLGAALVFALPAILAFVLGFGGMMVTSVGAAIAEEGGSAQQVAWTLPLLLGSFGGIAFFGGGMLLLLAVSVFVPVALAHMIATDEFAAAFRFREWGAILRANLGGFALATVIVMGVGFVFSFVAQILQMTLVLCCLVPLLAGAYSMYVGTISSALFGLVYRDGQAKLAAGPAPALAAQAAS
jgi:hypothetical protein